MTHLIKDLPHGPLDEWRKQASFDWKKLKLAIEGEERIEMKNEMYEKLSKDPLFIRDFNRPSLEESREINFKRWKRLIEYNFVEDMYSDLERFNAFLEVLETYDQGLGARYSLHYNVFGSAVMSMGTDRHRKILEDVQANNIVGCFCLTELSHGSNTADIQTTATFDNGEFRFDTPTQGAMKVWAGNLAFSATHAIVFAQLYVGGKRVGMHGFVIQIRDTKTYKTLPGITIGDMGEKPGQWNGVENGWMIFKGHRAPLWTLLNKGCDVTPKGEYVTEFKSDRERKSVSLGALSIGRVGIVGKGVVASQMAAVIGIRYSAVRKQFGAKKGEEEPVLTYPLQQHRLFPILAAAYTMRLFQSKLNLEFQEYMARVLGGEKSDELAEMSKEVHGLSSAAKPISTWTGVNALHETRMACGGHGYLYSSRLNDLRDSHDPSQTFEGENNMIGQQASNFLLAKLRDGPVESPLGTTNFLSRVPGRFTDFGKCMLEDSLDAFRWLIHYLTVQTAKAEDAAKKAGMHPFHARNESQVYLANTLTRAYAEHAMVDWARQVCEEMEDENIKKILRKLITLHSLCSLEKHLSNLYIGGYCSGPRFGEVIRSTIRKIEHQLLPDAVALADAIAPPDFVLHSALGASDGRAYDHLESEFRSREEKLPPWVKNLAAFINAPKSKM